MLYTKISKVRKQAVKDCRELLISVFGITSEEYTEQNEKWSRWVELNRTPKDLCDLISCDVKDVYKARAASILFAPATRYIPFEWPVVKYQTNYLRRGLLSELLAGLKRSDKMADFLCRLFLVNVKIASEHSLDPSFSDTTTFYNYMIVDALVHLGENSPVADELFSFFKGTEWVNKYERAQESYEPALTLFRSPAPVTYKLQADRFLRSSINRACGRSEFYPDEDWISSYCGYRDMLKEIISDKELPYGPELLSEQIQFILKFEPNHTEQTGEALELTASEMYRVLDCLHEEKYSEVKRDFASYMFVKSSDYCRAFSDVSISSSEDYEAAEVMLTVFADQSAIVSALYLLMNDYEENQNKESVCCERLAAKKIAELKEKEAVLATMK